MTFTDGQRKKSENKIQREGLDCALNLGIELTRTQAGKVKVKGGWMNLACKGWSDTTGYNENGQIVMIEFKDVESFEKKNHGASEDQLKRLNDVKSKGGLCGIACCNDHVIDIISGVHVGLALKVIELQASKCPNCLGEMESHPVNDVNKHCPSCAIDDYSNDKYSNNDQ